MTKFVIELIIKGKDKRNEISFFRLRASNGMTIMQSEKYKNVPYSIKKATEVAMAMGCTYKQIRNNKKERVEDYSF